MGRLPFTQSKQLCSSDRPGPCRWQSSCLPGSCLLCKGLHLPCLPWPQCAESIAFYNGGAREAAGALGRLALLIQTGHQRLAWLLGLGLWTNAYSYATILLPSILTAPRYFAGRPQCCPVC